ncbi:MAG: response regulator [Bacteriovoracaceae bacterium]|nr:response regulator [Bacteriovoracaceae bacterium]
MRKKLLIVDSDLGSKDSMLEVLQKSYEVVVIDNAVEAVAFGEKILPDIILVDLDMPQIDGFEFLNALDEHPTLCDVPVISMIDNKDEKYSRRAYAEGSNGMIYKPFNIANLERDIEGILKRTSDAIISSNKRISFYLEFSERTKLKKIKEIIKNQDFENEPLVLLTWNRGEDLIAEIDQMDDLINSNRLIFLEIKPSLISKFPYLQDVTPVVLELKSFLSESSRKYHLVMEEPGHLLNIEQREKSISQAYNMAQLIHHDFNRTTYVSSRPDSSESIKFTFKIGNILTGVRN